MCGCECCIFSKSIHFPLLTWKDFRLKHLKDRSQNSQNRRSGEISSCIFERYNNTVRPHGCHIHNTYTGMDMVTMCNCTSTHHGIPHWKLVLSCCEKCPSIAILS